jgi:hypothetical protein
MRAMRNTELSGQPAPAAIDFNLLLVKVPFLVIEFDVNPFTYIWCFSGEHFDAGALVTTAENPIQDVGFVNQTIVPPLGGGLLLCMRFLHRFLSSPFSRLAA